MHSKTHLSKETFISNISWINSFNINIDISGSFNSLQPIGFGFRSVSVHHDLWLESHVLTDLELRAITFSNLSVADTTVSVDEEGDEEKEKDDADDHSSTSSFVTFGADTSVALKFLRIVFSSATVINNGTVSIEVFCGSSSFRVGFGNSSVANNSSTVAS